MKRFITLLAVCMLLSACSQKNYSFDNDIIALSEEDKTQFSSMLYDILDYEKDNYFSNGVRVLNCDDLENIQLNDTVIYPVYEDSQIKNIIIRNNETTVITLDEAVKCSDEDELAFIEINDNIYLYKDGECIMVDKNNEISEAEKQLLKKISSNRKYINVRLRGKMVRTTLRANDFIEEGRKYASNRIVIKFAEGNEEEYVQLYKQFCKGELVGTVKSAHLYIFTFDNLSAEQMKQLIEKSEALDYVVSAKMDGVNEMQAGSVSTLTDK